MAAGRPLRCAALAVAALAAPPAGCGGEASGPPRASVARDCRSHVEGRLPAGWRRDAVAAGPLALYPARAYRDAPDPSPGARFVGEKTLAIVAGGREATVAVPAAERLRASLDYAYGVGRGRTRTPPVKVSDGVPVVRFTACGEETQFNGGIIVRWGRCLPLDVWADGAERPRRVEVSFGAGDCGE